MKTLSEFLAEHILNRKDFVPDVGPTRMRQYYIKLISEGIEAYKEHLQNDRPKTVQWTMIEKKLISALEKMQSQGHTEKESDLGEVKHPICPLNMYFEGDEDKINKENCDFENRGCSEACEIKIKPVCLTNHIFDPLRQPCPTCKLILACTDRKNRHCKECLLFNLKSRGNCKEPGYGTKANNNACDRFKLNAQFKEIECYILNKKEEN